VIDAEPGRRILIVEDSAVQGTMLRRALTGRGYAVEWARNGAEALKSARRLPPDLVVADIEMPVMDGYELCSRLRADPLLTTVPVILLTSLSDPEDIVRGLNAGADNYLTKPFQEDCLVRRIESLLNPVSQPENLEGLTVRVAGQDFNVRSDRQQILNLLISTFENAVEQNRELVRLNAELSRANRELEERNQTLETLNKQKNEMLGMAAHDLRNPLGVILTYSLFLLEDDSTLTDQQSMFVTNMKRCAESMLHLVEDLLDVSALESGTLRLRLSQVDLKALIDETTRLNQPQAAAKDIELSTNLPEQDLVLQADGPKLEQVLNNLISNAVKFSLPGTRVQVTLREEPDLVVLSVSDQGQGIPEREMGRLFQPFGRTSVRSTGGERSTGLGLAIAKNIVEAHRGHIEAQSKVKQGSTFTVTLPRD